MDSKNFLNNTQFRFTSKTTQDEFTYNPPEKLFKYYQLCSFKNPWNGKFHIRRFVMNAKNEFELAAKGIE